MIPEEQPYQLQALLIVLLDPELADQLNDVHDLALYDSGDALLGPQEKEALQHVRELARRLAALPENARQQLRDLI